MESYNKDLGTTEPKKVKNSGYNDRVLGGLVVLAVGAVIMAYQLGADIPKWILSWPMFLIALGIYIGARHSFRNWGWMVPVLIGTAFLVDRIFWDINIKPFIWPGIIILVGLFMIFRPKRKAGDAIDWTTFKFEGPTTTGSPDEEILDNVNVFGSTKKNILSKNFKGGDVVSFFGGCELNLTQADIHGPVLLEVTTIFGGGKLIVPSNWKVQSEIVSVFGGVDDRRLIQSNANVDSNKVLILRGTCVFGGLEIKSY